jgi:hypothetical protein
MTSQHPIVPPAELIIKWKANPAWDLDFWYSAEALLTEVYQAGADRQLEVCCTWVQCYAECGDSLRLHCRPLNQNEDLKEAALKALDEAIIRGDCISTSPAVTTIRQALKQLNTNTTNHN